MQETGQTIRGDQRISYLQGLAIEEVRGFQDHRAQKGPASLICYILSHCLSGVGLESSRNRDFSVRCFNK